MLIVCLVGIFGPAIDSKAFIFNNTSANISLGSTHSRVIIPNRESSTDSDTEVKSSTFGQRYTLAWYWRGMLTNYISSRANISYITSGYTMNNSATLWNSSLAPRVNVNWTHPDFGVKTSFSRHIYDNSRSVLTNDNARVSLNTAIKEMPLRFSYGYSHFSNDNNSRDNESNRVMFDTDYGYRGLSLNYRFSRSVTNNNITNVENTNLSHSVRWGGNFSISKQLSFVTNYSYNHGSHHTRKPESTQSYIYVTPEREYFGINSSPDFGELEPIDGLSDENKSDATDPVINIGSTNINRNIGLELSFSREINALYVYTDTVSGDEVNWDVYTSLNNAEWSLLIANATSAFNDAYDRYEISFPKTGMRFVKIVNTGFNSVDSVLITEIEALIESGSERDNKTINSSHIVDASTNYRISDAINYTIAVSYNRSSNSRSNVLNESMTVFSSSKFIQSDVITHSVNYQTSKQMSSGVSNYSNRQYGYRLRYTPLETLQLTLNASNNDDFSKGEQISNNKSIYLQSNGNIFPGLGFRAGITYSRSKQMEFNSSSNSWVYRASLDGYISRQLSFIGSYNHRQVRSIIGEVARKSDQDQYTLNSSYRISRTIILRGTVDISSRPDSYVVSQSYFVNWRMSSQLSTSAQLTVYDRADDGMSTRFSFNGNYSITTRSNLSFGFSENRLDQLGGNNSNVWHLSFRTSL